MLVNLQNTLQHNSAPLLHTNTAYMRTYKLLADLLQHHCKAGSADKFRTAGDLLNCFIFTGCR